MSFFENPNVDTSSQVSEESVIATKEFFLQKNGFLVREEIPDKGVDFDVELIIDGQVSGFKFAIQIKSAEEIRTIEREDTSYISYSIKTSRLGYLCRRSPGFGLIVIYDGKHRTLYYDFVEDIAKRIESRHKNEDWMQNAGVTFHIPRCNIVDNTSIKAIYEKMKTRCLNFNEMYARKATAYDLPTFESNKLRDPVSILEKYGYLFFNKREYQTIYSLLSEMNLTNIINNRKILLLATITYFHIGQSVEGDYFLRKCEAFLSEYTDDEKELLQISKLVSDFSLGRMNRHSYYEKLEELKLTIKGDLNSIYIGLQLSYIALLNVSIYDDETALSKVFAEIDMIQKKIDSAALSEELRYFCMMEIASFMHEIGVRQFLRITGNMMIQKRMLGNSPLDERLNNAKLLIFIFARSQKLLHDIREYSKRTNNAYMEALVLFKKTYIFYSFALQTVLAAYANGAGIETLKERYPSDLYRQAYQDIFKAYDIFEERRDLNNAYKCLTISLEVNYLFSVIHNGNIDDKAYKQSTVALERLEKELNLKEPYTLLTEKTILDLMAKKEGNVLDDYASLTTEEKYQLANMVVKSTGIPPERVDNLISEINFMQRARDAVNSKYFDVLQNLTHTKNKETFYKETPRYVIRCKRCNYETVESADLDTLLACLRMEHNHICF